MSRLMKKRYDIVYHPGSKRPFKAIFKADRKLAQTIQAAIAELADDPQPANSKVLKHRKEYLLCRLRVAGKWRIFYGIANDMLVICVLDAQKRSDAYENDRINLLDNRLIEYLEKLLSDDES